MIFSQICFKLKKVLKVYDHINIPWEWQCSCYFRFISHIYLQCKHPQSFLINCCFFPVILLLPQNAKNGSLGVIPLP